MPGSATALRGNNIFMQSLYVALVAVPATVTASDTVNSTLTVNGVQVGDLVIANLQSTTAGLFIAGAFVSANNTITIQWGNVTVADITATAAQPVQFAILRPENVAESGQTALPSTVF
jgi:hypothetical protein